MILIRCMIFTENHNCNTWNKRLQFLRVSFLCPNVWLRWQFSKTLIWAMRYWGLQRSVGVLYWRGRVLGVRLPWCLGWPIDNWTTWRSSSVQRGLRLLEGRLDSAFNLQYPASLSWAICVLNFVRKADWSLLSSTILQLFVGHLECLASFKSR